jgi:hypothetical protein
MDFIAPLAKLIDQRAADETTGSGDEGLASVRLIVLFEGKILR